MTNGICLDQDGQVVTHNNQAADGEITLSESGQYLLAMGGSGYGNSNYSFCVDLYSQQPTQALPLNQVVNGNISYPGENDAYTFSGTAGQQLYYNALVGGNPNFTIRLYAPSGRQIYSRPVQNNNGPDNIILTETGQYSLVIDGNGAATGAYSFRLLDKATGATNLLVNPVPITGGFTALDSGVIKGNFNTFSNNQILDGDLYSFNGTAGELLYLHNLQGSYNYWVLYAPNGQVIGANNLYNDDELTLSATGQYLLLMQGNGNNQSGGAYSFDLDLYPQQSSQALTLNQVVNGNISYPGENDAYTFSGTAGQQLYYDALIGGNPNFTVRLYAPSGRQIYSGAVQNDIGTDNLIFTETGTYSLVIDGNGAATGAYSFRLLDKATGATNLSLNPLPITDGFTALDSGTISGNFGTFSNNQGLDGDLYSFSGTAGELLYLHNIQSSYNNWILYTPNGQYLSSNWLSSDEEVTLSATGQYLLVMQGTGNGNNYSFDLDLYPQQPTQSLILNQIVSGNISHSGENDTYTFSGTAGQQLYYDALVGNNSVNFTVRLYTWW